MKRKVLLIILIVLCIAFIWGNSVLTKDQSHQISLAVRNFFAKIFSFDTALDTEFTSEEHVLRKLAHITEFLVLGLLFMLLNNKNNKINIIIIMFSGLLTATLDETIQISSDRGSLVSDIWIDCFGFLIGIIIGFIINSFVLARKRKTEV